MKNIIIFLCFLACASAIQNDLPEVVAIFGLLALILLTVKN